MKSTGTSPESNGSYSTGWNARRSLNLLRMSLNCPRVLPVAEDDSDEEMEIVEEDVEKASNENETDARLVDFEVNSRRDHVSKMIPVGEKSCEAHQMTVGKGNLDGPEAEEMATEVPPESDVKDCGHTNEVQEGMIIEYAKSLDDGSGTNGKSFALLHDNMLIEEKTNGEKSSECQKSAVSRDSTNVSLASPSDSSSRSLDCISPSSLTIVPYHTSPVPQSPTFSISPVFENSSRKSLRTSSSVSASQGNILVNPNSGSRVLSLSFADISKRSDSDPLVQTSKNFLSPTEHLEASLHRGLQIIDSHQHSASLRWPAFRFPTKPVDLNPSMPVVKVDVGLQTLPRESEILGDSSTYLCSYCKNKPPPFEDNYVNSDGELQLVPIDGSHSTDKCKNQIPKVSLKIYN